MSDLLLRLQKHSRIKETRILSESEFFDERSFTSVDVPLMNVALSGLAIGGGLQAGSLTIAGESRRYKTKYALRIASCFLKAHPDAVLIFYDSEFGSPQSYFTAEGIDPSRVLHCPVKTVEQLRNELIHQLEGDGKEGGITRKDKVIIIVDSLGGLASMKELDDALEGKNVSDMTRAKALKALFRIVRPHLILKNIPLICINHTYKTLEMYSKDVMGGGTGAMYNSDDIWFIGRTQEKEEKDIVGFHFTIKVEKSRLVREGSKFPIYVSFDSGIDRWSGLVDLAMELGIVKKRVAGRLGTLYTFPDGKEYTKDALETAAPTIWPPLLAGEFGTLMNQKFAYSPEEAKAKEAAEKIDGTE